MQQTTTSSEPSQHGQSDKIFRFVTASSLFDGHDASINVFRRLIQRSGMEVIHLGHNRSVDEIVTTAIQEDADAICVSSYQGGHNEYFRYMVDCLRALGAGHIKVFGGGGGTMLPEEIAALEAYGVTRLYHADDGRKLGLDGVIEDMLGQLELIETPAERLQAIIQKVEICQPLDAYELAQAISLLEGESALREGLVRACQQPCPRQVPVIGMTGTGGAGKSSLVDEVVTRFLQSAPEGKVAILAFDPSKRKTGGALLGDRIRMNSVYSKQVYLRSMATRGAASELGAAVEGALALVKRGDFDLVIVETSGIGQGSTGVVGLCDLPVYVMTNEYGASSQLEKIDMIDFADMVVVNKFDKMGAEDALSDVLYHYADSRGRKVSKDNRDSFPVFGTIASNFNDPAVTRFYRRMIDALRSKDYPLKAVDLERLAHVADQQVFQILPPERQNYLAEIADCVTTYKQQTEDAVEAASRWQRLKEVAQLDALKDESLVDQAQEQLGSQMHELLADYERLCEDYKKDLYQYQVRGKSFQQELFSTSLSGSKVPRIAVPVFRDYGERLRFMRLENFPGHFPYTAGVFPLKSEAEDPKRMFAGEGGPTRTNKRFHYLCEGEAAKRLSTAFDSVTLYGEDPDERPDIYGKVGNSGVSIATLEHMKQLYAGFDLADPKTSVSLTINGPAPMILAMFLNAAIDFEVEKQTGKQREEISEADYERIRSEALQRVRGTVQADILKEEQGQNTCIFSSKFALKMMGDIQDYFINKQVRNFYSVSISGYHIAEAGANPISQLAFTLANAFTYVEYYRSRGMDVDAFAANLSFFFSMGLDPEYSVIGRVARRIWSIALREKYQANDRSCRLKYHVQTSGRSLHAQEIAFNDIRTTLQALMAVYDHCNSLHTNAYDEAVTTPTEESVRRAMAIQLVILREMGVAKCENSLQGSFFIDTLTDLVEEAVLEEFRALSRRGGVLGAMEKQYQRIKIQTESLKYEQMKSSGELPIVGVNTFLGAEGDFDYSSMEVIRATEEEKQAQIRSTRAFIAQAGERNEEALQRLEHVVLSGGNIFAELMETVKHASLGQITQLLYRCGGEYRRSM